MDRGKVIKGLACCVMPRDERDCHSCPIEFNEYCALRLKHDALELLGKYDDFCRFVTAEMLDEKNECGTCGAGEVFCRKLVKLGYMRLEDDVYSEVEHE